VKYGNQRGKKAQQQKKKHNAKLQRIEYLCALGANSYDFWNIFKENLSKLVFTTTENCLQLMIKET